MVILIITFILINFLSGIYIYYGGLKAINIKTFSHEVNNLTEKRISDPIKGAIDTSKSSRNLLNNKYKREINGKFAIYCENPNFTPKVKYVIRDQNLKIVGNSESFITKILSKKKYVVVEFPYKGKISTILGVVKVYPIINEYLRKNGHNLQGPIMEIYDIPGKKIIYRKFIMDQDA